MSTAQRYSVSVIVCTRDQPATLRRAVESVERSAAGAGINVQLIVVNDSGRPLDLVITEDDDVLIVAGPRGGAGAARAAGLAAARGTFISYCDDDDEWTNDHLRILLAAMQGHTGAALVYGDAAWRSTAPGLPAAAPARLPELGAVEQIHASDVLHLASAARDVGGFDPSLAAYEDIDLWRRMDEAHVLHHVPEIVAMHDRRPDCVTAVEHSEDRARLLRLHRQSRPCREWHGMDSSNIGTFDPATWRPPRRELDWQSPLHPFQGFGVAARELLLAVEQTGIDVALTSPPGPAAQEFARFFKPRRRRQRMTFRSEYWHHPSPHPDSLQIIATTHEGTLVPRARINALNQTAALVYLPCQQNLEAFRSCGLRAPGKVLPLAVNPERFPLLERRRTGSEPFTFGTYGALSTRKGIDVLIRAFLAAFRPHEPVRLLLKNVEAQQLTIPDDPRIDVRNGFWDHDRLLSFLHQLDVFVLPSRAEGFGLCGLEAMATGLPLIATNWSGPADYLDPADSFPLGYRLVDAAGTEANGVRYFGQWAEPDAEHLAVLMRHLFTHPSEATSKGRRASARIHAGWTWDRIAHDLRSDLDMIARGVSPA